MTLLTMIAACIYFYSVFINKVSSVVTRYWSGSQLSAFIDVSKDNYIIIDESSIDVLSLNGGHLKLKDNKISIFDRDATISFDPYKGDGVKKGLQRGVFKIENNSNNILISMNSLAIKILQQDKVISFGLPIIVQNNDKNYFAADTCIASCENIKCVIENGAININKHDQSKSAFLVIKNQQFIL